MRIILPESGVLIRHLLELDGSTGFETLISMSCRTRNRSYCRSSIRVISNSGSAFISEPRHSPTSTRTCCSWVTKPASGRGRLATPFRASRSPSLLNSGDSRASVNCSSESLLEVIFSRPLMSYPLPVSEICRSATTACSVIRGIPSNTGSRWNS